MDLNNFPFAVLLFLLPFISLDFKTLQSYDAEVFGYEVLRYDHLCPAENLSRVQTPFCCYISGDLSYGNLPAYSSL